MHKLYKPLVRLGINIFDKAINKYEQRYSQDVNLLEAEGYYPCENLIDRATHSGIMSLQLRNIRNKLVKKLQTQNAN